MEEKYLVWHVQGGLGKNVAATALCKDIKENHPDRQFILVCSWPEVFLNNPYIDRVYNIEELSYFYETYIENQDVLIFRHEPYNQTAHITKQKHLIENWCDLLNIKYSNQSPTLFTNYSQSTLISKWNRKKPILLLHTNGGDYNSPDVYSWVRDLPIEISQLIVSKYSTEYHIIHLTKPTGYMLEGIERIDSYMTNIELFSLLAASSKRILIDSCLPHASVALNLPSTVFWIGTSPKVFGYNIHHNIIANPPKRHNQLIDSYLFDYDFQDNKQECPYFTVNEMFDIESLDI